MFAASLFTASMVASPMIVSREIGAGHVEAAADDRRRRRTSPRRSPCWCAWIRREPRRCRRSRWFPRRPGGSRGRRRLCCPLWTRRWRRRRRRPRLGARARADSAVIAAEHDDVAHQRQIRAANLADARTRPLLHAIAGGEILLLHDVCRPSALHDSELAVLRRCAWSAWRGCLVPMFCCVPKIACTAVITVE